MPEGSTINRKTREEVQESIDNLRKSITKNENNRRLVRAHYQQISQLLRTYGFLGVR